MPTSAIFHTSDPERPVAWALAFPFELMGHTYVLSDHRGKGLGSISAMDLWKKVISEGIIPEIVSINELVIDKVTTTNYGYDNCGLYIRLMYTPMDLESQLVGHTDL